MLIDTAVRDTVLHIGDLHFWHFLRNPMRQLNNRFLGNVNVWARRRHEFLMHIAGDNARHAASLGIPQAVLTGDFTSTALDEEYVLAKTFIEDLRAQGFHVHAMPGNHDVYTYESERKKRFQAYLGEDYPTQERPLLRRLDGGTPLILVDTVRPNWVFSRGIMRRENAAAVAGLLETLEEPILVAGHYPVLNETYAYRSNWARRLEHAARLRTVLGESGKHILYLHGHVHRSGLVVDPAYEKLWHLATDCFFRENKRYGSTGEFSEIRVADGTFAITVHRCVEQWSAVSLRPRGDAGAYTCEKEALHGARPDQPV